MTDDRKMPRRSDPQKTRSTSEIGVRPMAEKNTVITLRSLTHSIKAKKLLYEYGIDTKVVKPDAQRAEKGCGYGLAVNPADKEQAENLLRANGISPLDIR